MPLTFLREKDFPGKQPPKINEVYRLSAQPGGFLHKGDDDLGG